MTDIGFIGLGVMGRPMAANLLRAGHTIVVHNRSRGAVDRLVAEGALAADTPADVARRSAVVITMLPASPEVRDVVLGADGVLSGAAEGLLLIDMSTIDPETSRLLAAEGTARGVRVLDAPVSGGEQGAVDGALSIMVGGTEQDFQDAAPIFDVLGKTVALVGPHGSGQVVKAANQMIVAGTISVVSEAVALLEHLGVAFEPALRVLAGGLAGSRVLDAKAAGMVRRQFQPGFRIDLQHKDLGIALAAAREAEVVLPMTALVAQLYVAARAAGRGGLDHSALYTVIEDLSRGAAQSD